MYSSRAQSVSYLCCSIMPLACIYRDALHRCLYLQQPRAECILPLLQHHASRVYLTAMHAIAACILQQPRAECILPLLQQHASRVYVTAMHYSRTKTKG